MPAPNIPFTQLKNISVLDVCQSLTHVQAHVFLALGAFASDPIAPSERDLCDYTKASRPSVSEALRFLCKQEFAHCFVDEEHVRRYHADERFFLYKSASPVSVRELVPASERKVETQMQADVKTVFTSDSSSSLISNSSDLDSKTTPPSTGECAKILQAANVRTSDLDLSSMEVERAQAIADYIRENPEKKRSPAGWVYTLLKANPAWQPPQIRQQSWYTDYKEFIQR